MCQSHPFGALLTHHRQRKAGLTQKCLAHQMGCDAAMLARMASGQKDLTGPSGRDRVLRLLAVLIDAGVLHSLSEANALLVAARMHPLYAGFGEEKALFDALPGSESAVCAIGDWTRGA